MRISALLVTTAIIGGVAGSTAIAQTASGSSASAPTIKAQTGSKTSTTSTTMKAQTRRGTAAPFGKAPEIPGLTQRKGNAQKKSSRRIPPPPPPTTARGGSRQTSSRKEGSANEMFAADPTGRRDLSGRPVPFYPSSRSLAAARNQQSAVKQSATAKLHDNPQKGQ
jgi:hypothetical protein